MEISVTDFSTPIEASVLKFYVHLQVDKVFCVCLFDLILYVPSTIFHYVGTGLPELNQY